MINYKDKYLKYKKKYIDLKNIKGGYREFVDSLDEFSDNPILENNYTLNSIKFCNEYSIFNNDSPVNYRNAFVINNTRNMISFFMKNIISTNIKNDFYYSLPLRIFIVNYITYKVQGKTVNLLRSNDFFFKHLLISPNALHFVDHVDKLIQDAVKEGLEGPELSAKTKIDSNLYRPYLISTNLSLFGNEYVFDPGESTYDYWIKGATQTSSSLKKLLDDLLPLDLNVTLTEEFYVNINKLYDKYSNEIKSVMYQVLIPDELVNLYTYISVEYGRPLILNPLEFLNKNIEDKKIDIIRSITDMNDEKYGTVYNSMMKVVEKYASREDANCTIPTIIQSRIFITPSLVNDENIKVFFYLSGSKDSNDTFMGELDKLINETILSNDI